MIKEAWFDELLEAAYLCQYYKERFELISESKPILRNQIPMLDKHMVRENVEAFLNSSVETSRLIVEKTSGSTGVPISCYRTAKEQIKLSFILHAQRKHFNTFYRNDRMIQFGAFSKPISQTKHPHAKSYLFSSYYTDSSTLSLYIRQINNIRPTFIQGFPSILYSIAKHAKQEKLVIDTSELTFLEARAEMLTDQQKAVIEEVFNFKLANHYGSSEFWSIAYSCEHGELHLIDEAVHVEIVDEAGLPVADGETGEVIVTGKIITSMPLIRYRIGDIGFLKQGDCRCDKKGARLRVVGRSSEDVLTASGYKNRSLLSPVWLILSNQSQIQVIQTKRDAFRILYCGDQIDNSKEVEIKRFMQHYLGCNELALSHVDYIMADPITKKVQSFIPLKD